MALLEEALDVIHHLDHRRRDLRGAGTSAQGITAPAATQPPAPADLDRRPAPPRPGAGSPVRRRLVPVPRAGHARQDGGPMCWIPTRNWRRASTICAGAWMPRPGPGDGRHHLLELDRWYAGYEIPSTPRAYLGGLEAREARGYPWTQVSVPATASTVRWRRWTSSGSGDRAVQSLSAGITWPAKAVPVWCRSAVMGEQHHLTETGSPGPQPRRDGGGCSDQVGVVGRNRFHPNRFSASSERVAERRRPARASSTASTDITMLSDRGRRRLDRCRVAPDLVFSVCRGHGSARSRRRRTGPPVAG